MMSLKLAFTDMYTFDLFKIPCAHAQAGLCLSVCQSVCESVIDVFGS